MFSAHLDLLFCPRTIINLAPSNLCSVFPLTCVKTSKPVTEAINLLPGLYISGKSNPIPPKTYICFLWKLKIWFFSIKYFVSENYRWFLKLTHAFFYINKLAITTNNLVRNSKPHLALINDRRYGLQTGQVIDNSLRLGRCYWMKEGV